MPSYWSRVCILHFRNRTRHLQERKSDGALDIVIVRASELIRFRWRDFSIVDVQAEVRFFLVQHLESAFPLP